MEFRYKGYDESGRSVTGRIDAESEHALARKLREGGVFLRSAAKTGASRMALPAADRAALWRELGALLEAGLAADAALALLRRRSGGAEAAALCRVEEEIRAGKGFAAAIREAGTGAGAFENAAIASAENGAALPQMLEKLADWLDAREAARASVRASLAYPAFVLALGAAVALGMALWVVPEMSDKLARSGVAMPPSSRIVVGACRLSAFVLVPLAAACAVAAAALRSRARKRPAFALALDRLLCRLPMAQWRRASASHGFASVLAVLAGGGTPLADALELAAAATGRPCVEDAAREGAARIRAGKAPSAAIAAMPEVGEALAPWVEVGEAGGCLPRMLEAAARRQGALASRILGTRLALLGPVLLAAVGAFVLALSLALLVPVLQLSTAAEASF